MKKFLTVMLLLVVAFAVFAQASKEAAPAAAATKELKGELNVYSALAEKGMQFAKEKFEEKYPGVTVNFITLAGGEMGSRVKAEAANPLADVMIGSGCESYIGLKNAGVLASYKSPSAANYADRNHDPDWYWTAFTNGVLGFYVDKAWCDKHNVAVPTSWAELLNPVFKGNITLTNPGTSTTGYMVITVLTQLMGEEKGMDYLAKLHKNVKSYEAGGQGPSQKVALGEAAIGIGYVQFGMRLINQGYKDMVISFPKEGTGLELGCTAKIANCKNPEIADAFLDFVLSEDFGNQYAEFLTCIMMASGASTPEYDAVKNTLTYVDLDLIKASADKDRLVSKWDSLTSK